MAKSNRNQSRDSQRINSNRNHDFDTDSDLGNYVNDEYYRNEGRRNQRSDYDFEQADRPNYGMNQGRGLQNSPMDFSGRYGQSEFRNSRDYTGNFPSAELSGLGRESSSGYDRSWGGQSSDNRNMGSQYGQQQGQHAGKGPKGYQRSEERIREDVCDALEAHAHIDASEIEVEVSEGIVTLTGSVDSRQAKRIAEQAVESVRGVRDINNQLTIEASENLNASSGFQASAAKSSKSQKKSNSNYKQ